jgi:hypothetical protein
MKGPAAKDFRAILRQICGRYFQIPAKNLAQNGIEKPKRMTFSSRDYTP